MPKGADALLQAAIGFYQEKRLAQAERMFRTVLETLGEESTALSYLGLIAMESGRLDEALELGIRAIKAGPNDAGAHHRLGSVLMARRDPARAAGAFQRAAELLPGNTGALILLARNAVQAGAGGTAAEAYRELVRLMPRDPGVAFEAANFFHGAGLTAEAGFHYLRCVLLAPASAECWSNLALCGVPANLAVRLQRRALALRPGAQEILTNLGTALLDSGERAEALALLIDVMQKAPASPGAHYNLAAAYGRAAPNEALHHYVAALALQPGFGAAWVNLGGLLIAKARFRKGALAYGRALSLEPASDLARVNRAMALTYAGDCEEPAELLRQSLIFRRGSAYWPVRREETPPIRDHPSLQFANGMKLRHDVEQFRYLQSRGIFGAELDSWIAAYETIASEIEAAVGEKSARLPEPHRRRIGAVFNRVIHYRDTPRLLQGAVSPKLDRDAIMARYREPPGITWVDDLLTPQALDELRAFLLESTVWSDLTHNFDEAGRAYLGTYFNDGFSCPLILQIAAEFKAALPEIFRDYPLMQLWAYKSAGDRQGLEIHADAAAVNVNFWITPNEANADPDSGGLTVWTAEAPADWSFDKFNNDRAAIETAISAPGVRRIDVPYAQNRAVVFNSDLFHATQRLNFKPGYENRRINITMLFGTRDKDWHRQ